MEFGFWSIAWSSGGVVMGVYYIGKLSVQIMLWESFCKSISVRSADPTALDCCHLSNSSIASPRNFSLLRFLLSTTRPLLVDMMVTRACSIPNIISALVLLYAFLGGQIDRYEVSNA